MSNKDIQNEINELMVQIKGTLKYYHTNNSRYNEINATRLKQINRLRALMDRDNN